ncbi:MAG TPA: thiosulfohydrolase SoxB [Gammaproteobacteria bacterium]|nr:thiosulfohydrolase SoxB [Gammaproteobacteria bacterium]
MSITRREFIEVLMAAGAAGFGLDGWAGVTPDNPSDPYELPAFGNVSLMHFTDCHAQLQPVYFREPSINLGIGTAFGRPPHLTGEAFLNYFHIKPGSREAYAYSYLNFAENARKYGKMGGFAHLATLIAKIRAQRPGALLLDGGDTWQGSATALWTRGQDMADASKLLGVDMMTGHWEFTYGIDRVQELIATGLGDIEFLAQNVFLTEDAQFDDKPAFNTENGRVFKPWSMRVVNGIKIAVIGQAFPYSTLANPRYKMLDWSFGIHDETMQQTVDAARTQGAKVVVVLSHNGMDVDLKMASRVTGVDAILGGHTHDAVPTPQLISNAQGKTLVINSGSNAKYLSVLDFAVSGGKVSGYRYHMLPVFSNLLPADSTMQAHIDRVRAPYKEKLDEVLATTYTTLYRRGNFNGSFDQLILDASLQVRGADIAFSPGFRWGTSLLPGDPVTMEHLLDQTAITYAKSTLSDITGETLKNILEDIADNLFNPDPYYQMGGDMVRVGGLKYTIDPGKTIGNRLSHLEFKGQPLDPAKTYKVAGWASVNPQSDTLPDIWDIVAPYLRDKKEIHKIDINLPVVKGVANNPGFSRS